MDPYLEDPDLWPDVHVGLISQIQADLNQRVGPKYYVRIEERVYIADEDDPSRDFIVPDVRIGKMRKEHPQPGSPAAVVDRDVVEPVVITTLLDEEIHEAFLKIIDKKTRRVVTVLEVVSPTNKVSGSSGRASYQKKRAEIMNSPTHWVEIDLHRTGQPLVPRVLLTLGDYFVHLSRADKRPKGYVWPIRLPDRLPVVAVPLNHPDPDVKLDLQLVLDTAYDRAAYYKTVDYRKPPVIRLPRKYVSWANRILKGKGYR
jgi:hypothetical protein